MGIVPVHHVLVPRDEAVTNLVRLVPTMFFLWQIAIEKDALAIRQVKGLQGKFFDRIKN